MKPSLFLTVAALSLLAQPGLAASWDGAFAAALPPEPIARVAIDAHPDVERAKSELDLARAQGREYAVGPHEFTLGGYASNRTVTNNQSYEEFGLEVSRAIRLPGKASLDRAAGDLGVKAALDLVDDARHQTGLTLSDAWYAWIEAAGMLTLDRETEASYRREVDGLKRRVELSDAAIVELEQAQAALASAVAHRTQSEGAVEVARMALARTFPDLVLPANPPALPAPPVLDPPAAQWSDITLRSSHEVAIADFQAQQAEALARRARLDRRPDPTIGVRTLSEFGGREKSIGVFFSTPLGGAKRSAVADSEAARANTARIHLAQIKRESAALGERNAANSDSTRNAWLSAAAAVEASETATRRIQRGYELGELDLAAVLTAGRQLYEVKRAEISARTNGWRALTHLRLDAHDMWHDADDGPLPER